MLVIICFRFDIANTKKTCKLNSTQIVYLYIKATGPKYIVKYNT